MNEGDDEIIARVRCNLGAMKYWALQYGPYVEVLEPKKLRDEIKTAIGKMAENYSK